MHIDEDGWIVDEDGNKVPATDEDPIRVDELAGIVEKNGLPTPLRDTFPCLVDHASDRRSYNNHETIVEEYND